MEEQREEEPEPVREVKKELEEITTQLKNADECIRESGVAIRKGKNLKDACSAGLKREQIAGMLQVERLRQQLLSRKELLSGVIGRHEACRVNEAVACTSVDGMVTRPTLHD